MKMIIISFALLCVACAVGGLIAVLTDLEDDDYYDDTGDGEDRE